jgi:hypothetical protein
VSAWFVINSFPVTFLKTFAPTIKVLQLVQEQYQQYPDASREPQPVHSGSQGAQIVSGVAQPTVPAMQPARSHAAESAPENIPVKSETVEARPLVEAAGVL